jgi:hypothetical protein
MRERLVKTPVTLHITSASCEGKQKKGGSVLRGVTITGEVKRGDEILHAETYVLEPGDSVIVLQGRVGLEMEHWAVDNTEYEPA